MTWNELIEKVKDIKDIEISEESFNELKKQLCE